MRGRSAGSGREVAALADTLPPEPAADVSLTLLSKQLGLLPAAQRVKDAPPPMAPSAFLRRCDELLDRGREGARERGAASYFGACAMERRRHATAAV